MKNLDIKDFDPSITPQEVMLYPKKDNPIQKHPQKADYSCGCFHLKTSKLEDGPDYYLGDILTFIEKIEPL